MEDMEFVNRLANGGMNVVYLSSLCGKGDTGTGHRCNHACQVEHVWANLHRCVTTGSTHVCDKNCNQRILYDNHSSICRVSGQIFPLSPLEKEATKSVRRKRDADGSERCFKRTRSCETPRFDSRFHIAVPATGSQCETAMDLS